MILFSFLLQVDIVDFNGSFLARIRDLAGANPIILVITKVFFRVSILFSYFIVKKNRIVEIIFPSHHFNLDISIYSHLTKYNKLMNCTLFISRLTSFPKEQI